MVISSLLLFWGNVESKAQINFGVKSLTFHNSLNPMDQSLGSYFGANIGQNVVLLGGIDYGRLGLSVELSAEGLEELDSFDEEVSFSYIMPHAGMKFYLRPREEGGVSPYFFWRGGKVIWQRGLRDIRGDGDRGGGSETS